jgi:hypothetical protein
MKILNFFLIYNALNILIMQVGEREFGLKLTTPVSSLDIGTDFS